MFACANAIYFRLRENAICGYAARYLPAASDMRLRRVRGTDEDWVLSVGRGLVSRRILAVKSLT